MKTQSILPGGGEKHLGPGFGKDPSVTQLPTISNNVAVGGVEQSNGVAHTQLAVFGIKGRTGRNGPNRLVVGHPMHTAHLIGHFQTHIKTAKLGIVVCWMLLCGACSITKRPVPRHQGRLGNTEIGKTKSNRHATRLIIHLKIGCRLVNNKLLRQSISAAVRILYHQRHIVPALFCKGIVQGLHTGQHLALFGQQPHVAHRLVVERKGRMIDGCRRVERKGGTQTGPAGTQLKVGFELPHIHLAGHHIITAALRIKSPKSHHIIARFGIAVLRIQGMGNQRRTVAKIPLVGSRIQDLCAESIIQGIGTITLHLHGGIGTQNVYYLTFRDGGRAAVVVYRQRDIHLSRFFIIVKGYGQGDFGVVAEVPYLAGALGCRRRSDFKHHGFRSTALVGAQAIKIDGQVRSGVDLLCLGAHAALFGCYPQLHRHLPGFGKRHVQRTAALPGATAHPPGSSHHLVLIACVSGPIAKAERHRHTAGQGRIAACRGHRHLRQNHLHQVLFYHRGSTAMGTGNNEGIGKSGATVL